MPVIKYKSFEQAQEALWQYGTGKDYYRQIANLFDFCDRIRPCPYPSGIFRYESFEDFNTQKNERILDFAPKQKTRSRNERREKS